MQFEIIINTESGIRETVSFLNTNNKSNFKIVTVDMRDGVEFATIELPNNSKLGVIFDLGYYYALRHPPKPIKSGFKV